MTLVSRRSIGSHKQNVRPLEEEACGSGLEKGLESRHICTIIMAKQEEVRDRHRPFAHDLHRASYVPYETCGLARGFTKLRRALHRTMAQE